jgi:hypothetical protein
VFYTAHQINSAWIVKIKTFRPIFAHCDFN